MLHVAPHGEDVQLHEGKGAQVAKRLIRRRD